MRLGAPACRQAGAQERAQPRSNKFSLSSDLKMKKLSLAYFGSPDFSAVFLKKLLLDKNLPLEIKFVVTQPDKPAGREQIITPCPVKTIAEKYNLRVFSAIGGARERDPDGVELRYCDRSEPWREGNSRQNLLRQLDLVLVYAYGEIIPEEFLSLPKLGFWNIHPSLLPKYRGPTPIATPLIRGDVETGVTIIKLIKKLDAGPIIAQKKFKIPPFERQPDLINKLTDLAYELFVKTINKIPKKFTPQNEQLATYTQLLKKDDGFISLNNLKEALSSELLSQIIFNKFRGLYSWPGLWTIVNINGQEKRLKITDVDFVKGKLILKKTQLEGKKEVDFEQFNAYYRVL